MEGIEDVTQGFREMGASAEEYGNQVEQTSNRVNLSYGRMLSAGASVISQSMSIAGIMRQVQTGHMDVAGAALMLSEHFLRLGRSLMVLEERYGALIAAKMASIATTVQETAAAWAETIAQNARALAVGIANAISSMGILVPVMLAAAGAITVGILAEQGKIPGLASGGIVTQTGLAVVHEGEHYGKGLTSVTINIYGDGKDIGDKVINSLRAAGVI